MKLVVGLQTERRASRRSDVAINGQVSADARTASVLIEELSTGGFLMLAAVKLNVGDSIHIDLPGIGDCEAMIIRQSGVRFGCTFATPLSRGQNDAVMKHFLELEDQRLSRTLSGWRPGRHAFAA